MPANKIAVIETRLPYTDRRALSEAWFSALHLSHETPHAGAAARHSAAAAVSIGDPKQRRAPDRATHATTRRDPARGLTHAARRAAFAGLDVPLRRSTDVRAATSAASAAFDRARSYPPFRTSLTLEGANGTRVHLIVRRVGATLHVVALCPPAVEHLVRRALASADLHFRACGERLQVDVNKSEARA